MAPESVTIASPLLGGAGKRNANSATSNNSSRLWTSMTQACRSNASITA
jgi:hypothetical protein